MTDIKVSIVVPVYNVSKFLDRCINSLSNQTLNEVEIILIDDNSTDNSLDICQNWSKKDDRIKVVHKENEGLGLTRNAGIEIAKGEYVAFVDSDDYVDLTMFEKLYNECITHKLDCIYSEFNVDEYPGFRVIPRQEEIFEGDNEIEKLRLDIIGAEPSYVSSVKYHCSSCKGLYSLSLIKNNNIRFLSERDFISEDMLFNLDFLLASRKVKIVPWQLYHYCLNDSSLTHSYRSDRWEKLLKMLVTIDTPEKFKNKLELSLRIKRTAIFYSYDALRNEKNRKDISIIKKIKAARIIENNKILREYLNNYPIRELPKKWKIYSLCLKYRVLSLTFFLV